MRLDLSACSSLTTFASNSNNLTSLQYLNLQSCEKLSKFSVTLENIVELNLTGCRSINALPSSFGCQSKLETRKLRATQIKSMPSSIKDLTRLRKLDIKYCKKLVALPELPSSVETLLVYDCYSLKTVLFPSTVAEQLKENKKEVEFWNCRNLDKSSLINIGLNVQINLMKFANAGSDQAVYVYPGSSVPDWLVYRTTKNDMIVDLSQPHLSPFLGFVLCFVFAEGMGIAFYLKIKLKIATIEGDDEKEGVDINLRMPMVIDSDHVCMIYNQPCSEYLTRIAKIQTSFKIKVTAWTVSMSRFNEEERKVEWIEFGISPKEREVELNEFGISPINQSTYQNLIQQMEYECAEPEGERNKGNRKRKRKEGAT